MRGVEWPSALRYPAVGVFWDFRAGGWWGGVLVVVSDGSCLRAVCLCGVWPANGFLGRLRGGCSAVCLAFVSFM